MSRPCKIREPLRNAVDQHNSVDSLAEQIKTVYADLQQSLGFRELVEAARRFTPVEQSPVFHETLVEDHQCRLSLIGIHRFAPIPVHDHPHITRVQLVIHGRVQVRTYRIQEVVREPSLVRLVCRGKRPGSGVNRNYRKWFKQSSRPAVDESQYHMPFSPDTAPSGRTPSLVLPGTSHCWSPSAFAMESPHQVTAEG